MVLALLAALSLWLSAGTLAVVGGDTPRIAALPSLWILGALAIAAVVTVRIARLRGDQAWPLAISLLLWLPFLPGSIPAAFLLWQGPIEAIVWLVVAAGLIAVRRPALPARFSDPKIAPMIAGVMLAVAAFAAFSQVRGVIPGGDEPHYLAATQSLLHDGDLRVANNYVNGEYLDYFPGRLEPHFLKRATSGEIYSIHAPGVSLVVLPAFAVAGYNGAIVTMILIAAFTAALCWRIAFRVCGDAAAAWIGVVAVFGTAPYFLHTFTIYPEVIGGFLVSVALLLIVDLEQQRDVSIPSLIVAGLALALLPWLHSRFAVLAGLLGLMIAIRLAARSKPLASIAAFLGIPAIAGAAWFAYFWVIWGSPSPTAPYGADTSTSSSYIVRGLIGLLVDQQFGVLTTAPVYLTAIAGVFPLFRQQRRLTIELLVVVALYAITVASYQMWWAGSAAPARFLVSTLPLAVLPIAVISSRRPRTIAILLLIVSVTLVMPRVFVEGGRFIFNNRAPLDATLDWLSQVVDLPSAFPSVHRDGGWTALRDASVWLAALIIAAGVAAVIKRSIALAWTATALALGVAVMASTTIVWSLHQHSPLTPERSKLAALAAYRPAWQTPGFLDRLSIALPAAGRLDRLPAGDYEITPSAGSVLFVGRNDAPIESNHSSAGPLWLRLPVAVRTLHVKAEQPATLRPLAVRRPAVSRNAIRAARYGPARVFVFDDWVYLEPDGFWTRSSGAAAVVIDSDDAAARQSGLPISITGGAVDTSIDISIGNWRESFSLTAGQRQEVVLPATQNGVWPLRIRSGAGFRPSEREPGSRDVRSLAAWIAIR